MKSLFSSMHAIAAQWGEGLLPESIGLSKQFTAYCTFGTENLELVAAFRGVPEIALSTSLNGLNVEIFGPSSLLPSGHKCSMHFDASGTPTVTIGARNYSHGYASPYFAGIVVSRLGIQATRIRLYYAGNLPAAMITFRDLRGMPNRDCVGRANAWIGDLIEGLCKGAIEKGRRYLADSIGVGPGEIYFDAPSGRFFGPDKQKPYVGILELAGRAHEVGQSIRVEFPVS